MPILQNDMESRTTGTVASERLRSLGWTACLALGFVLAAQTPRAGAASGQSEDDPQECLALALYWEAGSDEREGMAAVASVVLNRRAHPDFPSAVCEVVREGGTHPGCQFTFWCDGKGETPRDAALWARASEVAAAALEGRIVDVTGGALFFHAAALETAPWEVPRERTIQIGRHVYYR